MGRDKVTAVSYHSSHGADTTKRDTAGGKEGESSIRAKGMRVWGRGITKEDSHSSA